jgi:hypothetical protein
MLRSAYDRVAATVSYIPAVLKPDTEDARVLDPDSPHVVKVRETAELIDVRSIEGVTYDEDEGQYKVEYKVPPIKQSNIDGNPVVASKLNVERRPDGMYLTQYTDSPEAAHAISRFIKMLWEDGL